jgi:membrane protein DedA with SNARE-associated domain
MPVLMAADPVTTWWQYVLLFLAVAASFAGIPAIGATALGAAAVAASQGKLDIAVVIVVATAAGEVGGLIGYFIGNRWGRQLLERPGKHQAGRQKMVEEGERAYARYGPLAVFFTPAIVSGTARMRRRQFILWNLVDSFGFSVSVAASAYGLGKLVTGNLSGVNVASLLIGVLVGALLVGLTIRHHRRARRAVGRPASDAR